MNIGKDIKKIKKIENIQDKKDYVLNCLNSLDYNRKLIFIDELINIVKSESRRLTKVKEYYLTKLKVKKANKIILKLEEQENFYNELKIIKNKLKKENKNVTKLLLSVNQIKEIDELISEDTYSLIIKLNNSETTASRLEILNELKKIYDESLSNLKGFNDKKIYPKVRLIKIMREYVNDSIKYEHKKQSKNKKAKMDIKEEIDGKLTKRQETIVNAMKNNSDISCYNIKDILIAYKEFIVKFASKYPKNILNYSKYITNYIVSNDIDYNDIIVLIGSIRDTIKNRLLELDKDNIEERKILKEIRIVFDFISKNYREDNSKTKHNYGYDVINYFLQSEEGYPYIKKIITELPKFVNIRSDDEHILISILKEFIYNQKKMLKDKNSSYINPDYLKQVYILFSHSEYLRLTIEEKTEINCLISEYIEYLKDNVDKLDRQKEMKKEICSLRTNKYFINKVPKLKNVDKSQFMWHANHISQNKEGALNRHNRIDLSNEFPISFNNNTCYSITETEEEKKIKINVLDMACMVPINSAVDSQMYNDMINHDDIHFQILRHLKFDYDKLNPTITYEITLNKANCIKGFKIYRSKTNVTKCNDRDLYFEDNETLNKLAKLSNKLLLVNNVEFDYINIPNIEKIMNIILNEQIMNYIDKNNIPFIYSGVEYINDYIDNMNNLNTIFSRLEKDEFRQLYLLINNNVGEFGYSKEKFEVEGSYELNLINNINYLSLFNQRLIVDIILEQEQVRTKDDYIKEIDNLEHNLNLSIDHIRPDDMVFKNKRKRNKLKEYNVIY